MAARAEHKILRIGVIQGGKIVEERLVRKREPVTIGSGPKNTVVVPASNLPKSFTLFELKGSQYQLTFTDHMDGRVSVGDGVVDFASLKAQNLARRRGGVYAYPLQETARGKVTLGDVTLLFQFVTPPPEPVRPTLPAAARGGWVKSIDKIFTAIFVISMAIHLSSAYVLENTPLPPEGLSFDQIPDRFLKLLITEIPDEEPIVDELPGETVVEKTKKEEDDPGEEAVEEEIKRKGASKEVQEKVRSTGILAILGSISDTPGSGGLIADILGTGAGIGGDLDEALANVSGVSVATGADALGMRKGVAGGGGTADVGDMRTGGGGRVGTGTRRTPRITGRIRAGRPEIDEGTVDRGSISRFIRARLKSVTSCYEAELKRNPTLKGKLLIRIVINTRGMVGGISIEQDTLRSPAVVNCVRNRIRPWRFPVKPENDVTITVPFIFAPSG